MKIKNTEINEALPKDLRPRYRRGSFFNPSSVNDIDIQNSSATELTPEQALSVIKSGNPYAIRAIVRDSRGYPHIITFNERGKVDSRNSFELYRNDPRVYTTKDGDGIPKYKLTKMPAKYVLSLADKIYQVNEVAKDPTLLQTRSTNVESPNYNLGPNTVEDTFDIINLKRKIKSSSREPRYLDYSNEISKDENGLVTVPGYYGGKGDANYWEGRYSELNQRYGKGDPDVRKAWIALQVARGADVTKIPNPNYIDSSVAKARLRYWDNEKFLKAPIEKIKKSLQDLRKLQAEKESVTRNRDDYSSPEKRLQREGNIKAWIDSYRRTLRNRMIELEKYENRLDELDDNDITVINEYNDKINKIAQEITNLQNITSNQQAAVKGSYGYPVPESLQEGKSLDELVDENQSDDDTDEDIISKYTR